MVVDLVRSDDLVEVQTGSLAALGSKLDRLLSGHRVVLVHPIAERTVLVRNGKADRRSPRKGSPVDIFGQLVSIPTLIDHPNLTIDVVMTVEEKVKVEDPELRRRRGGWRTVDRRLLEITNIVRLSDVRDLEDFVPDGLPEVFTTADLASVGGYSRNTAQQIAYCLRALDRFVVIDRTKAGYRYRRAGSSASERQA